jgi:hypothetical protein
MSHVVLKEPCFQCESGSSIGVEDVKSSAPNYMLVTGACMKLQEASCIREPISNGISS